MILFWYIIKGTSSEKKDCSLERCDESTDKTVTEESQTETVAMITDESATSENKVLSEDNAAADTNNSDQADASAENTGKWWCIFWSSVQYIKCAVL